MKRPLRLLCTALVGAAVFTVLAPASGAASGTTMCTSTLAPGIYAKVVVPMGAVCTSTGPVTITGGLFIQPGATFVLGDESMPGNNGTITGGVHATNPMSVQIHFMTIVGGIDIRGGSGPFGGPFDITWNAIEDNHITGNVTVDGYNGFWMGFIRNTVTGNVRMTNNTLEDPDGNEYVTNTIVGNFSCSGNAPAPQVGDSEGSPNQVTGNKSGQCAAI